MSDRYQEAKTAQGERISRKRRAIIIYKDARSQQEVARFFAARGYEAVVFGEYSGCPVYGGPGHCSGPVSCGDVMIVGTEAPMTGIELIAAQHRLGCQLTAKNKAIIAPSMPQLGQMSLAELGAAFFPAPVVFRDLERWVSGCENRMDLQQPVAVRRREARSMVDNEPLYFILPGNRLARGIAVNRSPCGVCFTTAQSVTTNDMIMLSPEFHKTAEDAVVRWVRAVNDTTFIVGISYCV